jgi:hypothetical protein
MTAGTLVGGVVAGYEAQDGGLASTVGADQSHALAIRHDEADVTENVHWTEATSQPFCIEHESW